MRYVSGEEIHRVLSFPAVVHLVGGYTPETREADDEAARRARIFVDRRESAFHGVGDILQPIASGAIREEDVLGDLYDLIAGGVPGRAARDDITLFIALQTMDRPGDPGLRPSAGGAIRVFPKSAIFACATRRPSDRNGCLGRVAPDPRGIRRPVAQHRIEEARQAAGQRDDGDLLSRFIPSTL